MSAHEDTREIHSYGEETAHTMADRLPISMRDNTRIVAIAEDAMV